MSTLSPEALLTQLKWRYAVKKFDPARKISPELWSALEDSLVLAPSSYGLQPWKFFVVTDVSVREKLLPHSWGQKQVVEASHLVVLAVKKDVNPSDAQRLVERTALIRGVPVTALDTYHKMMAGSLTRTPAPELDVWMSRQVFIALGCFLNNCAMLGVDTCPMEGFVPEKYDEILGLPAKGYLSRVVATVGYRHPDDPNAKLSKVRFAKEEVIEHI